MDEYVKQAQDFLDVTGSKVSIRFKKYGEHFNDGVNRNIYRVTIARGAERFAFDFGDSINNTINGIKPSAYDVLTCLNKYDYGNDVWEFACDVGFDICDKKSYNKCAKMLAAVNAEYYALCRLYPEEEYMEMLCGIQ